MNKLRVNVNDVLGQIRLKGYNNIDDIDYLIMETSGQMSILASEDALTKKCKRIPIAIVLDGKILDENIDKYNLSKNKLEMQMQKENLSLKDIIYAVVDENDNYMLYRRS